MSALSKKVKAFHPLSRYPEVGSGEEGGCAYPQGGKFLQGYINYPGVLRPAYALPTTCL